MDGFYKINRQIKLKRTIMAYWQQEVVDNGLHTSIADSYEDGFERKSLLY